MQSNTSKVLVAVGSAIAIVALFFVFSEGDRGGSDESAVSETSAETSGSAGGGDPQQPATDEGRPAGERLEVPVIVVRGGEPEGGVEELEFAKGEEIRFRIDSNVDDEVHVHGYDVSQAVTAGQTTELAFPAEIDGVYEVELENSAVPIAELTISP